jgi:hypothetical protein
MESTVFRLSKTVSNAHDALIDNHGYLVIVEKFTNYLDRFDSINLTRINNILFSNLKQMIVTYFNGAYYTAPKDTVDNENLVVLTNISTSTY